MSHDRVLAIDQGTSSTKALIVAPDGAVLALHEVPVHPTALEGGVVEQDPEALRAFKQSRKRGKKK